MYSFKRYPEVAGNANHAPWRIRYRLFTSSGAISNASTSSTPHSQTIIVVGDICDRPARDEDADGAAIDVNSAG